MDQDWWSEEPDNDDGAACLPDVAINVLLPIEEGEIVFPRAQMVADVAGGERVARGGSMFSSGRLHIRRNPGAEFLAFSGMKRMSFMSPPAAALAREADIHDPPGGRADG